MQETNDCSGRNERRLEETKYRAELSSYLYINSDFHPCVLGEADSTWRIHLHALRIRRNTLEAVIETHDALSSVHGSFIGCVTPMRELHTRPLLRTPDRMRMRVDAGTPAKCVISLAI